MIFEFASSWDSEFVRAVLHFGFNIRWEHEFNPHLHFLNFVCCLLRRYWIEVKLQLKPNLTRQRLFFSDVITYTSMTCILGGMLLIASLNANFCQPVHEYFSSITIFKTNSERTKILYITIPITVVARSEPWTFSFRSNPGVVGSNLTLCEFILCLCCPVCR
jgi:hypothetical protein